MKKAVWIAIASLAIVGIVTGVCMLASKQYWDSKAAKIEFMLWDRNHENEAHVTDADLIRSVSACGATATAAGREIHISIDTRFVKKKWTIERQQHLNLGAFRFTIYSIQSCFIVSSWEWPIGHASPIY